MSKPFHQCAALGCKAKTIPGSDFCPDCHIVFGCTEANRLVFPPLNPTPTETDPNGKSQHEPGAKVDAGKPRMHLITGGMARALVEVAKIGTFGAAKYTDGGWVDVPDGFRRYEDAQQRHAAYRHMGEIFDKDSKELHLAHEAWNALAKLDLYLREQERQPK
jgi:hypothetical protein